MSLEHREQLSGTPTGVNMTGTTTTAVSGSNAVGSTHAHPDSVKPATSIDDSRASVLTQSGSQERSSRPSRRHSAPAAMDPESEEDNRAAHRLAKLLAELYDDVTRLRQRPRRTSPCPWPLIEAEPDPPSCIHTVIHDSHPLDEMGCDWVSPGTAEEK